MIVRWMTSWWMPLLVLTALMIGCLLDLDRLAFRDVGFFYTPLYQHVARFDDLGSGPAWNSLDGTGMPLAGETTTAVFYPVRWIVYRLADTPTRALSIYVWLHLLLASLTARRLASTQTGPLASSVAGWIYPMSGSVLFLVTNAPFLVSAAWLPMAFHFLARPNQRGSVIDSGVAIAMMILAGDPQTALHVILVFSGWLAIQAIVKRDLRRIRFSLLCMIKVLALAAAIASPQWMASWDWSRQSDRGGGVSAKDRYAYSIAPWRFTEYLTQNASGHFFPQNERITTALPGDGSMWTPSLYMGAIAAPAFMASLFYRRRRSAWIMLTLFAAAASMGHFGLVWWIQTSTGLLADTASETGGLYWMLCKCVPGYDWFRYPAKWLPLVSLGTTLLSCRLLTDRSLMRWRHALLATTVALMVGYAWTRFIFRTAAGTEMADEFWGPLKTSEAIESIHFSFLVSVVVLTVLAVLVRFRSAKKISWSTFQASVVAIIAMEMTGFAATMIPRVPIAQEESVLAQIRNEPPAFTSHDRGAWMRYSDWSKWPSQWRTSSDDDRLATVEASLRASRFGRWHLAESEPVLNSMVTIGPQSAADFWNAHRFMTSHFPKEDVWRDARRTLNAVGTMDEQGTIHVVDGRVYRAAKFATESSDFLRYDKSVATLNRIGGESHQAIYEVDASSEWTLTRPVYQDGHWFANIQKTTSSQTESRIVVRDEWMQTVNLPAGQYQLRFEYRPWWHRITCFIALTTGLATLFASIAQRWSNNASTTGALASVVAT
jgi:hypothetical protein